ncbi:hypothetical protein BDZ91DRAFT_740557 [Kalaharituber pfeilii]|nr:hypothetical protein BDZ91DRAFT_740557 [Kalaharituber pfeilii]
MSATPPPNFDSYKTWILSHVDTLAYNGNGFFVGSKQFKKQLIALKNGQAKDNLAIRQAVNFMVAQNMINVKSNAKANSRASAGAPPTPRPEPVNVPPIPRHPGPSGGTTTIPPSVPPIPRHPGPSSGTTTIPPSVPLPTRAATAATNHSNTSRAVPGSAARHVFPPNPSAAKPSTLPVELAHIPSTLPPLSDQLSLLRLDDPDDIYDCDDEVSRLRFTNDDIRSAIFFSPQILTGADSSRHAKLLPQYGLMGRVLLWRQKEQQKGKGNDGTEDTRVFLNTNVPASFFICGVQGGGKSHTLASLLENYLIPTPQLGVLRRPLSALVLHFGEYSSKHAFRPLPPSNYKNLAYSYSQIPHVTVHPLKIRSRSLTITSMLTLMAIDQSQSQPLYMAQVTKILRDMATDGADEFNYSLFKHHLSNLNLNHDQKMMLSQRLDVLESFLEVNDEGAEVPFSGEEGTLTIVDLSCPFVDAGSACVLFNICIGQFLAQSSPGVGKVIAVDEAHKYLSSDSGPSTMLTSTLLSIIRQQRHLATRIIIATQEPTISPRLMDLASVTFIHRFTSPDWFNTLRKHLSIANKEGEEATQLFRRIQGLRVGEALVFAPSAILVDERAAVDTFDLEAFDVSGTWDANGGSERGNEKLGTQLKRMREEFFKVKVRSRVTQDGGKSIFVFS